LATKSSKASTSSKPKSQTKSTPTPTPSRVEQARTAAERAVDVPVGATSLEFTTYGGRGTLAAYANYEAEPMPAGNIGASVRPGTNQIITIASPAAGHYYFKVTASAAASGVMVRAKVY